MVSIIIPTFNRSDFLKEAIESVRVQTFPDWELLVVDDGSTDESWKIVSRFRDARIHYLHQKHSGVSRARNTGMEFAQYPWICFLDSDDRWYPGKLQRQLETLDNEPAYRAIYTNEIWIRKGRRVNQKNRHRKYSGWIYRHCLPLCIISPSSVMLHKEVLDQAGGFDEEFPVCEDYDLWLKITCRFPVRFLDEPLIVKYGGHDDQLSRSRWGMDEFRVRALIRIAESGLLRPLQMVWTAREIVAKAGILLNGFEKRGKVRSSAEYREVIEQWLPRTKTR